jgi:hypothetical protein
MTAYRCHGAGESVVPLIRAMISSTLRLAIENGLVRNLNARPNSDTDNPAMYKFFKTESYHAMSSIEI